MARREQKKFVKMYRKINSNRRVWIGPFIVSSLIPSYENPGTLYFISYGKKSRSSQYGKHQSRSRDIIGKIYVSIQWVLRFPLSLEHQWFWKYFISNEWGEETQIKHEEQSHSSTESSPPYLPVLVFPFNLDASVLSIYSHNYFFSSKCTSTLLSLRNCWAKYKIKFVFNLKTKKVLLVD